MFSGRRIVPRATGIQRFWVRRHYTEVSALEPVKCYAHLEQKGEPKIFEETLESAIDQTYSLVRVFVTHW